VAKKQSKIYMSDQIKRVLNLVRKTGDSVVVLSEDGNTDPCVILPLDKYEEMTLSSEVKDIKTPSKIEKPIEPVVKEQVLPEPEIRTLKREEKVEEPPIDDISEPEADIETQFYLEPVE